ncbi:MAG TPA: hypothetical protein VMH84_04795 [Xanthobacteraceae bacterium]|nr:hypothetical protein [Xanthobacteraceae bacterium]
MRPAFVLAATSIVLSACSNMPSLELPSFTPTPAATTLEFESEPPGAEVRTSTNQTCRTPCSLSVTATELTATFALAGYTPQTIPVRTVQSNEGADSLTGTPPPARMTPNPVYAELVMAAPVRKPPPAAAKPPKKKPKTAAKPKPKPQPQPQATTPEPMTSAPAAAPPASPWPPVTPPPTQR